jgi:hypothetical protein
MMAQQVAAQKPEVKKSSLPDHVLRAIRGEMSEEEKHSQYDKSLGR